MSKATKTGGHSTKRSNKHNKGNQNIRPLAHSDSESEGDYLYPVKTTEKRRLNMLLDSAFRKQPKQGDIPRKGQTSITRETKIFAHLPTQIPSQKGITYIQSKQRKSVGSTCCSILPFESNKNRGTFHEKVKQA